MVVYRLYVPRMDSKTVSLQRHSGGDINRMESHYRIRFVNSLSGFKSANLCGTVNAQGGTNLAIISSAVHLGARPAMMGMVMRPAVVPRHTLENILEIGYYTLNHVNEKIYKRAHQTSAKYPAEVSEFKAVALHEFYTEGMPAPYVEESLVRIGLRFRDHIDIAANGTTLIVGEIIETHFPPACLEADGFLDIRKAGTVTVAGLDAYHRAERVGRLSRATVPISVDSTQ